MKGQGIGNAPCKNIQWKRRLDANCDRHIRINMGGEAASPTNPKKVRAGKRKTKYIDCLKDSSTQDQKCVNELTQMNLRLGL